MGSTSVSAGPLVVCVWSGRWSSDEVRRKPVARLLKDAALRKEKTGEFNVYCKSVLSGNLFMIMLFFAKSLCRFLDIFSAEQQEFI